MLQAQRLGHLGELQPVVVLQDNHHAVGVGQALDHLDGPAEDTGHERGELDARPGVDDGVPRGLRTEPVIPIQGNYPLAQLLPVPLPWTRHPASIAFSFQTFPAGNQTQTQRWHVSIRLLTVIPVVNQALGEVLFTSVVRLTRRPFASFRSCL